MTAAGPCVMEGVELSSENVERAVSDHYHPHHHYHYHHNELDSRPPHRPHFLRQHDDNSSGGVIIILACGLVSLLLIHLQVPFALSNIFADAMLKSVFLQ